MDSIWKNTAFCRLLISITMTGNALPIVSTAFCVGFSLSFDVTYGFHLYLRNPGQFFNAQSSDKLKKCSDKRPFVQ